MEEKRKQDEIRLQEELQQLSELKGTFGYANVSLKLG